MKDYREAQLREAELRLAELRANEPAPEVVVGCLRPQWAGAIWGTPYKEASRAYDYARQQARQQIAAWKKAVAEAEAEVARLQPRG